MILKTISLWQPWASLLVGGHKKYETRSWASYYYGWMAIHAAKYDGTEFKEACLESTFQSCLLEMGYKRPSELPRGAIVGFALLNGCYHTGNVIDSISTQERHFGNYERGRYAWHFPLCHKLETPILMRGQQGIFTIEVPDSFGWELIMERLEGEAVNAKKING